MSPESVRPEWVTRLEPLVGPYLARQAWAQTALGPYAHERQAPSVTDVDVLRTEHPGMASVIVECGERTFHLVIGWRSVAVAPGVLGAQPGAVLGPSHDGQGDVLVYDALADAELVVFLLAAATGGAEQAQRARVVQSLVSHSSVVYDDRLLMKCYRVIEPRSRPEIEMVRRLDAGGFKHMLDPVAHWQRDGRDLALVRAFVPGAVEGLALARTSLRDLLAHADASENGADFADLRLAGGDLGPEMRRLGETTAEMHLALAEAFGTAPAPADRGQARDGGSAGPAIRVHGDYHLRRVMRTDEGWLVAGFGDDPLMGEAAGAGSQGEGRFASALEDVADLCCSLSIAAAEAVAFQTRRARPHARLLAEGWERHNVSAFVGGYLSLAGISRLVPEGRDDVEVMLGEMLEARRAADDHPGS
jgi:maltokinase